MNQILFTVVFALVFSLQAFASLTIESAQSVVTAAETVTYSFQLVDEKTSAPVTDNSLVKTHTKLLHLVVYDKSLNEFNHVHPEFDGALWTVKLNLPVNGTYMVWAQGETDAGSEFSVYRPLVVENGLAENAVQPLGDVRTGSDGITQVELDAVTVKAGKMVMLDFAVTHTDGTAPQLSPYLGAFAHVIATALNGGELIHVHPMEAGPTSGMLHATFPSSGEYRLWIQFIDGVDLRTIPLSVVVK
jgi:hypothetical protein